MSQQLSHNRNGVIINKSQALARPEPRFFTYQMWQLNNSTGSVKCTYSITLRRLRIFASWTLLRRPYHWIHWMGHMFTSVELLQDGITLTRVCKYLLLYFYEEFITYMHTLIYSVSTLSVITSKPHPVGIFSNFDI